MNEYYFLMLFKAENIKKISNDVYFKIHRTNLSNEKQYYTNSM